MKNQDLFKEAIADAKDVRNAALANANKVLEEALTPKVESMINKKLAEIEESEDVNESQDTNENTDLATGKEPGKQRHTGKGGHTAQNMEEELESILQELGMDDSIAESEDLEEGEVDENFTFEADEEAGAEEAGADEFSDDASAGMDDAGAEAGDEFGGEEAGQEEEVVNLTVSQLSDIIRATVQDVLSGGAGAEMGADAGLEAEPGLDGGGAPEAGMDAGMDAGGEEEVDLDELLASLDESEETNESEDLDESEEVEESADQDIKENWYKAKTKGNIKGVASKGKIKESGSLVKPLNKNAKNLAPGKGKVSESGSLVKPLNKNAKNLAPGKGKISETEKELKEAVKVIRALKSTLNETNLLNAKLLYVNKIFKAKTLTEAQKIKVVSAFDKANNKEEAKMIFESLNETLNTKKPLKESAQFGFASKATGIIKSNGKNVIVEDATVKRFQKLAGLSNND